MSLLRQLGLPWQDWLHSWQVIVICSSTPVKENTSVYDALDGTKDASGLNAPETLHLFKKCFE
jgi:hypothetical protein